MKFVVGSRRRSPVYTLSRGAAGARRTSEDNWIVNSNAGKCSEIPSNCRPNRRKPNDLNSPDGLTQSKISFTGRIQSQHLGMTCSVEAIRDCRRVAYAGNRTPGMGMRESRLGQVKCGSLELSVAETGVPAIERARDVCIWERSCGRLRCCWTDSFDQAHTP